MSRTFDYVISVKAFVSKSHPPSLSAMLIVKRFYSAFRVLQGACSASSAIRTVTIDFASYVELYVRIFVGAIQCNKSLLEELYRLVQRMLAVIVEETCWRNDVHLEATD